MRHQRRDRAGSSERAIYGCMHMTHGSGGTCAVPGKRRGAEKRPMRRLRVPPLVQGRGINGMHTAARAASTHQIATC